MTKEWFKLLHNLREIAKETWACGGYTTQETGGTMQLNSEAIGKVGILSDLIEIDWTTFNEGIHEQI